jgi:uncharacterized membrane protein
MNAPTNTRAKKVKLFSFLAIVLGLVLWIVGFAAELDAVLAHGPLLFFGGFFGFVVGRFME